MFIGEFGGVYKGILLAIGRCQRYHRFTWMLPYTDRPDFQV